MKRCIVIVPGLEPTDDSYFGIINRMNSLLGVEEGRSWTVDLQDYFRKKCNADVYIFDYTIRIPTKKAVKEASRQLSEYLNSLNSKYPIILFGKSLGGTIVSECLDRLGDSKNKIEKAVYIATPHRTAGPQKSIPSINIYSTNDYYARLANVLLHRTLKQQIENSKNIGLPGLRHSDFNHDREIVYSGKRRQLFEVYQEVIERM